MLLSFEFREFLVLFWLQFKMWGTQTNTGYDACYVLHVCVWVCFIWGCLDTFIVIKMEYYLWRSSQGGGLSSLYDSNQYNPPLIWCIWCWNVALVVREATELVWTQRWSEIPSSPLRRDSILTFFQGFRFPPPDFNCFPAKSAVLYVYK